MARVREAAQRPGRPATQTVAIVGLGLIGGSLGMALRRFAPRVRVVGCDARAAATREAIRRGAIEAAVDLEKEPVLDPAVHGSHAIVVAAAPVASISGILWRIGSRAPAGTLLTDVGSAKAAIHEALDWALPRGVTYLGGHPMAGSEMEGIQGAHAHLFAGMPWILTPGRGPAAPSIRRARKRRGGARVLAAQAAQAGEAAHAVARWLDLLMRIGARVVTMDALAHDRIAAAISHVPYLAATAVVAALGDLHEDPTQALALAASGFHDTTRVAAGPPPVYRDIALLNAPSVLEGLDALQEALSRIRTAIARGDGRSLERMLRTACALRRRLPARHRRRPGPAFDLVARGTARPAFFPAILGAMRQAAAQLVDLEVMHLRAPAEGAVRLSFASALARAAASRRLARMGLEVSTA